MGFSELIQFNSCRYANPNEMGKFAWDGAGVREENTRTFLLIIGNTYPTSAV